MGNVTEGRGLAARREDDCEVPADRILWNEVFRGFWDLRNESRRAATSSVQVTSVGGGSNRSACEVEAVLRLGSTPAAVAMKPISITIIRSMLTRATRFFLDGGDEKKLTALGNVVAGQL